jgi:hypothetical protein
VHAAILSEVFTYISHERQSACFFAVSVVAVLLPLALMGKTASSSLCHDAVVLLPSLFLPIPSLSLSFSLPLPFISVRSLSHL